MKILFFPLIVLFFLTSATPVFIDMDSQPDLVPMSFEDIIIKCAQSKDGNYVIRNEAEYKATLEVRSPHPDCGSYTFPKIDFSKYTLVGIVTSRFKCVVKKIDYSFFQNTNDNLVQFKMDIIEDGDCRDLFKITRWCLIEKIGDNTKVEFKINSVINPLIHE